MASNALAAGWGAAAWLRKDARGTLVFWPLLRVAQALVAAEVAVGLALLAQGETARDGLHVAYGIAPLLITLVSEGMRAGVAQRELEDVSDIEALERPRQVALARRIALGEMGVMTVGTLLILTLALRAFQTGG